MLAGMFSQCCCSLLSSCLQALLTALAAGGGSSRDVQSAIESALPMLLERLSDNNPRLSNSARDALVALAQVNTAAVVYRCLPLQRVLCLAVCLAAIA